MLVAAADQSDTLGYRLDFLLDDSFWPPPFVFQQRNYRRDSFSDALERVADIEAEQKEVARLGGHDAADEVEVELKVDPIEDAKCRQLPARQRHHVRRRCYKAVAAGKERYDSVKEIDHHNRDLFKSHSAFGGHSKGECLRSQFFDDIEPNHVFFADEEKRVEHCRAIQCNEDVDDGEVQAMKPWWRTQRLCNRQLRRQFRDGRSHQTIEKRLF